MSVIEIKDCQKKFKKDFFLNTLKQVLKKLKRWSITSLIFHS